MGALLAEAGGGGAPLLGALKVMKGRLWGQTSLFMGTQLGNLEWGTFNGTMFIHDSIKLANLFRHWNVLIFIFHRITKFTQNWTNMKMYFLMDIIIINKRFLFKPGKWSRFKDHAEVEIIKCLGREWFLSFWSSFWRPKKMSKRTRGGPVRTCASDCSRRLKLTFRTCWQH